MLCRHCAPGSPLREALDPKGGAWGLAEVLAGVQVDDYRRSMWAMGGRKGGAPKSVLPWADETDTQTVKGVAMTTDEMDAYIAQFRPTTTEGVSDD